MVMLEDYIVQVSRTGISCASVDMGPFDGTGGVCIFLTIPQTCKFVHFSQTT